MNTRFIIIENDKKKEEEEKKICYLNKLTKIIKAEIENENEPMKEEP